MRDPITDAAQDPSCLLCLTPDRGGSWWSRLRPPTPRNFADNPMTFTDSYTAQDGIGTDDFTLSVDFTLLEKGVHGELRIGCMYCIYYDSTKGYQPCVRILKSDGTKGALYPVGTSHIWGNVASIKVIKTGQNVRMVVHARDGSTIKEGTVAIPDGATVTSSSGVTNYPGNISAASIRNDTTGTDVWQAAYSDLYDTSNPWPSPVPRNFSAEPMRFYELADIAQTVGTGDDFEVGFRLQWFTDPTGVTSLPFSNQPYDFRINNYGNVYFYCSAGKTAGQTQISMMVSGFAVNTVGIYEISASVVGSVATLYVAELDNSGNVIRSASSQAAVVERQAPTGADHMVSQFSGTLLDAWVSRNGKRIWRYPSEAERVRLITKTNVRTDHGSFETADVSVISRVATQLDLRGAYAEKTFIADCWFPATSNNGTLNYFPVITQGDGLSGSGSSLVVNFSVQADYRASAVSRRLQLTWADASGSIHTTNGVVTDAFFGKRHQIVGVIRPGASSTQYANELYIDGELVGRGSGSVSSFVFGNATAASIAQGSLHVIGRDYTGFLSQSSLLYRALIFDRALSAAEIAALTPKQA